NYIFSGIDDIITKNHGYIYNYSGDAFFAIFFMKFDSEKIIKEIEDFIDSIDNIEISKSKNIKIFIKMGYSSGNVTIETINTSRRKVLAIYGEPVLEASGLKKVKRKITFSKLVKNNDFDPKYFISSNKILKIKSEFRTALSFFVKLYPVDNLKNEFIIQVLEIIESSGGFFNEIEYGDKGFVIPAFFGIPKMKLDSMKNAVKAGIEIIALAKKLGEKCKIGISGGKVLAGLFGGNGLMVYTALGDRVNTAARLMSFAKHNNIIADKETLNYLNVNSRFLSIERLKGKNEKIETFEVLSIEKEKRGKIFIGRGNILTQLKKFLNSNKEKILSIYGEAGIGKTYLVEHFLNNHKKNSMHFSFYLSEENINFGSYIDFLLKTISKNHNIQKLLNKTEDEREKETFKYFLLGKEQLRADLETLGEKERETIKINGMAAILNALDKQLILFFDDAQLLNEGFNIFIDNILKKCSSVKILGTFRGKYSSKNSFQNLKSERIFLKSFSVEDTKQYFNLIGIDNISDKVIKEIYKKTDGVPFFTVQVGDYIRKTPRKNWQNGIELTLDNIMISKYDSLKHEVKEFLRTAAVFGKIFDLDIIARILRNDNTQESIGDSIDNNIIETLQEMKYIFKHSIFKDKIYQLQLKKDLIYLHNKIAHLLKEHNPKEYQLIAFHLEMGQKKKMAAEYYYKIAKLEEKKGYLNNALEYFEKAASLVDGGILYHRTRLGLARSLSSIGKWDKAISILNEEMKDCKINKLRVEIYHGLIETYLFKNKHEMSLKFTRYLLNSKKTRFLYYSLRGRIYYYLRKSDLTEKMYKKALSYKNIPLFDRTLIYSNLGVLKNQMGQFDKALRYLKQAMKVFKVRGNIKDMGRVYANIGNTYLYKRKYSLALRYYKMALEIARKIGNYTMSIVLFSNIGSLYYKMGELKEAQEYLSLGLKVSKKNKDKKNFALIAGNFASIEAYFGRFEEALQLLNDAVKIRRELNDPKGVGINLSNIAMMLYELGRYKEGVPLINEAVKTFESIKLNYWIPNSYYIKFKIALELGKYEIILKDIERIKKLANEYKIWSDLFSILLIEARLRKELNEMEKMKILLAQAKKLIQSKTERVFYYETAYALTQNDRDLNTLKNSLEKLDKRNYYYQKISNTYFSESK
ncbi:tetratricopeptide repeat protein, partial [bacterium]|nr:tetratricopeptide repeat protein [bacterium]